MSVSVCSLAACDVGADRSRGAEAQRVGCCHAGECVYLSECVCVCVCVCVFIENPKKAN